MLTITQTSAVRETVRGVAVNVIAEAKKLTSTILVLPDRDLPEHKPKLRWPEMVVVDNLVDLIPTDRLKFDPRCMLSIGLVVALELSMFAASKDSAHEPCPEPVSEPEISWLQWRDKSAVVRPTLVKLESVGRVGMLRWQVW